MVERATYDDQTCSECEKPLVRRKRRPKLLSYLLFVTSFAIFFIYSSKYQINLLTNAIWLVVQVALGLWVMVDRRANALPLFYCRSCRSRLPFGT